jgi:biofilm PGA synthesis protein PgaD
MDHKALIIDSPSLQLATPRRSWAFVKSVGWLLWFMLWLPLFTLLGWYFGFETIAEQFFDRDGGAELVRLMPTYLLVIGICGGSLILWSLIQYWRFHGKNQRARSPDLETAALAEMTHSSVAAVQLWQGARRVVAYHDANAKIVSVDINPDALYGKALLAAVAAAEAKEAEVANVAKLAEDHAVQAVAINIADAASDDVNAPVPSATLSTVQPKAREAEKTSEPAPAQSKGRRKQKAKSADIEESSIRTPDGYVDGVA